jgi:hypothetical protein
MNRNVVSRLGYNEWPFNLSLDSPIFQLLREAFFPMLLNKHAEYAEPDKENTFNVTLLHERESSTSALPHAPPP